MIKTRLKGAKGIWPNELPSVLWAYQTTACTPTSKTPFRLAYGSEAVILAEVRLTSYKVSYHDERRKEEGMLLQLDLLNEVRATTEKQIACYQDLIAKRYNTKVKSRHFQVGDLVLRKVVTTTKDPVSGKLGPNWEGPYMIVDYHRKWTYHLGTLNGQRLQYP